MEYLVKNVLTKHTARLLKKKIHKHLTGMFLKVGNRKIAPRRSEYVNSLYMNEIKFLQSMGAIEIISTEKSSNDHASAKIAIPVIPMKKTKPGYISDPTELKRIETDDFVIISSGDPIFTEEKEKPVEPKKVEAPPVKPKEIKVEPETKVEESKTELILFKTENGDITIEVIVDEMVDMYNTSRGLTKAKIPELSAIKSSLGLIDFTAKNRNFCWELAKQKLGV